MKRVPTFNAIGVDFDNTIIQYDEVFAAAARERGWVPEDFVGGKEAVRAWLRAQNREDDWTVLQGYVYGVRLTDARPYPGVLDFFGYCAQSGVPIYIVSHKTLRPYRGPAYDLPTAARTWLANQGFHDPERGSLPPEHVFLEPTQDAKLARIRNQRCAWFVDDLPEFLGRADFPAEVRRVLFDPQGIHGDETRWPRAAAWTAIQALVREAGPSHA